MPTLKDWIIEMADGEDVEAIALGEMGGWAGQRTDEPLNTILSWEQALPWLSYEFNDDFGEEKCNDLYAWTPSWIICIDFHNGFPSPYRIPRNPAT